MDAPNTDELIGYTPPGTFSHPPYNPQNQYGYHNYRLDYDPYYRYDPYRDDENIKSDFVDFGFQFFLILLSILIPYLFYLIKRTLLRFKLLSPRVNKVLDILQSIFHRTVTRVASKLIKKKTGSHVSTNKEATTVISENISDHLNEKLNQKITEKQEESENVEIHPITGEPIIRH